MHGFATPYVLGGIKTREMLADDLVCRVPLDAFRPLVPRGHASVRIQYENRIVIHTGHHQAEPLIACPEGILRLLPLGDVSEDAGKEGVPANLPACEGKFQGELGPIFSPTHQLDRPADDMGFSRRKKPCNALAVGIVEPVRHEPCERLTDYVTRGMAEDELRPWVEVGDVSTAVCGHDGIGRSLSHGAEPFFALLQRLLCSLAGIQLPLQLVVDLLDLLCSPGDVRFHFSRARAQSLGDLDLLRFPENVRFHFSRARAQFLLAVVLLVPLLLDADELRDVLDAMDDVGDLPIYAEDR